MWENSNYKKEKDKKKAYGRASREAAAIFGWEIPVQVN
jgi:hypothetical protein